MIFIETQRVINNFTKTLREKKILNENLKAKNRNIRHHSHWANNVRRLTSNVHDVFDSSYLTWSLIHVFSFVFMFNRRLNESFSQWKLEGRIWSTKADHFKNNRRHYVGNFTEDFSSITSRLFSDRFAYTEWAEEC